MKKILAVLTALLATCAMFAQSQPVNEVKPKIIRRIENDVNVMKDPALGYVPLTRLIDASQYRENRFRQNTNAPTVTPLTWTERGPDRDVVGPSNGNPRGPGNAAVTSARIRTIWEDLADPTGKTVWAGSISGGLWKTNDITSGTAVWSKVDDKLPNLAISSICQDPTNHNIMYIGTGEKTYNYDAVRGGGIWQSTDHGITWSVMPLSTGFYNISKLLCDADGNLYAGSLGGLGGLYRYTKATNSWTDITPNGLAALVADIELSSTGRLHVSCGYFDQGPASSGYRFTDNPATVTATTGWLSPSNNFPFPVRYNVDLASKGDVVYALAANPAYEITSIYKSVDGGLNWSFTASAPPFVNPAPSPNTNLSSGQGWYCLAIAIDPNNADNVIVGSLNCYKTTNGGNTWSRISMWVGTTEQYVHADQHTINWRGNNQVLIGGDGGIDYSSDGGNTITDRNRGLPIKQFYSVAVHPTDADYFLAGAQDNGSHRLTTPGMNTSTELVGGDGGFTHIDQKQGQTQFLSYTNSFFYRSANGGSSWNAVRYPANPLLPVVGRFINPTDYDDLNKIMYCGGSPDTYLRWDNADNSLTSSFSEVPMPMGGGDVSAVKVSPYSNHTVFFAGSQSPSSGVPVPMSIMKVTQANTATPVISTIFSNPGTTGYNVSCIDLGRDDKHLLVSLTNYGVNKVWYSKDGGASWIFCQGNIPGSMLPDMPVRWCMFYPGSNEKAIIATETGIWQTDKLDGNATVWQPDAGFPNVRTNMLQYRRNDRLLVAATHGRGIFTANIAPDNVTGPVFSELTNKSVTLSWDSTGDALNYDIEYKPNSASAWITAGTAITDTFINVTGLAYKTLYDWRVRANWGPGTSSGYTTGQFVTLDFEVTSPNTAITAQGGEPFNITWTGASSQPASNFILIKLTYKAPGEAVAAQSVVLAARTSNDFSEPVILPNIATNRARIVIESLDTFYFSDTSDVEFTITPKPVICQKLDVQVFKRDTSFTCVTSDDNGNVYAGTQTKGLYKYDNVEWKNFSYGLNGLIPWKRTWMRQMAVYNNQLWVAHSGYISPIGLETDNYRYGGVERIDILNGPGSRQNFRGQRVINIDLTIGGPPTRNTFGVLPDTATGRIWAVSNYADSLSYPAAFNYNARYWYKTGGVATMTPGQGNFFRNENGLPEPYALGVGTGTAGTESLSIGKRRSASAITTDGNEVLVSVSGFRATTSDTLFTAGLLRYNRTTGAYIGKYDQNNTPLPFGLTNTTAAAPALYTDVKGRVWVALGGNRIAVKDTSGWRYIGVPTVLAGGGAIQPNAISGDRKGVIYFGTDKGLLVFSNNKATDSTAGSYTADSSYCLYTTANGLSTNYIRGTHVDKNGNIWLATGAGICKVQRGDLMLYNLSPVAGGIYVTNDDKKRTSVAAFDPETNNIDTIRIAADGSKATMFKWLGKDPNRMKAIIKEGNTPDDFGSLAVLYRGIDSLIVQYKHPEFLSEPFLTAGRREVTFQLFDTTVAPSKLVIEVKLQIVPPPVLCLHGIWSSGEAHNLIKQYLTDSAGYKKFMISNPDYPNDVYFINNKFVARDEISKLLLNCADNNMSAGKVDVIGHSMGGILSRIFLQSGEYDNTFHKLITINTPHSGSQIADLVRTSPALALIVNGILGNNTDNGALEDLRVTKDGIRVLLNGPANLNANKVPVHAITSRYTDLQTFELLANVTLTVASYIPALGRIAAVAKRLLATIKYVAYAGTTCNTSESVHNCLKNKIFEDDNDLAVALVSQKGGLPSSAISYYDNISHNAILDRREVFVKLATLLKNKTTDGNFTSAGYNPAVLDYNASITAPASPSTETVTINAPLSGATYTAGQNINIDIAGSTNIQKIMIASGNATLGMGYYNAQSQSYILNYTIPKEAIGKLYIVAVGFDNLGKSTFDSTYINVAVPGGATLDSIRITNRRNLKVYQSDSTWLNITGYYSDTVRDISNVEGISYVIDDVNVRMSSVRPNTVIGQVTGFDNFRASWQGKTDTGYIEILEKRVIPTGGGVIPVTLTSFTGRLAGTAVQLKWNTAQEINASHFEIERSEDGVRFVQIGRVQAKGNSSSNTEYSFADPLFKTGANYYRLRQVDADGKFSYSVVVLIRVNKDRQQQILIFPNPAGKYVNINVTEGLHPQWTLNLSNMVGQQLLTHRIAANQNNDRVQLPALAPGIYTVTILSAGGEKIYNGKLVIQQ